MNVLREVRDGSVTELVYETGSLYITVYDNDAVRISENKSIESFAIENMTAKPVKNVTVTENSEDNDIRYTLTSGNIVINIKDNMLTDVFYKGRLLMSDYEGKRIKEAKNPYEDLAIVELEGHTVGKETDDNDEKVTIIKKLQKEDAIYGLGDKPGTLNKRGYSYINWNTDDPAPHVDSFKSLYKSIPFFMVLGDDYCYGIFADNTYKTTFDFGYENEKYYYIEHEKGELDYYFIPGDDMAAVVKSYTQFTGTTPLYQRWIYGNHQSRWGYFTQDEVSSLADEFRANDIPLDVIHMDIDYMNGYRVFTFDDKKFPNVKKLSDKLALQGIKLISIIDPGVKKDENYYMYNEGMKIDAFAHDADGSVYENAVWPGTAVFPDFTKEEVRRWWGEKMQVLLDNGIRGVWNDMNEPASFNGPLPDDVEFDKGTHAKIHNVYGHLMAKATYEGLARHDNNRRPFVLTRAAYAGSQKYCGGWTGDNHSIWSHISLSLEQICNLSISGMAMCGSDIGGFGSDTTPELLVRFYEAAVFAPFFRNHSAMGTRHQEPFRFGKETTDAIRKTIKLRYRFIPYIYDLARECEKSGEPIVRPLVYEYPQDKNVRNISDEYMLGSNIIVAPVVAAGKMAREVYLPEGIWYDYYTGEQYEGGRYILADAPLDKVPLYIKAGAIIPVADGEINSTEDITPDKIKILTYPGEGRYVHYEDDNETYAYRDGVYIATEYTLKGDRLEKKIIHSGM